MIVSLRFFRINFGVLTKPRLPQTTVMMALITNSHLQPAKPWWPSSVLMIAACNAPDIMVPIA